MTRNQGFESAVAVKNSDGRTVPQLLEDAIKELAAMKKRAKKQASARPAAAPRAGGKPSMEAPSVGTQGGGRTPWEKSEAKSVRGGGKKKKGKAAQRAPVLLMSYEECLKRLGPRLEAALKVRHEGSCACQLGGIAPSVILLCSLRGESFHHRSVFTVRGVH